MARLGEKSNKKIHEIQRLFCRPSVDQRKMMRGAHFKRARIPVNGVHLSDRGFAVGNNARHKEDDN